MTLFHLATFFNMRHGLVDGVRFLALFFFVRQDQVADDRDETSDEERLWCRRSVILYTRSRHGALAVERMMTIEFMKPRSAVLLPVYLRRGFRSSLMRARSRDRLT